MNKIKYEVQSNIFEDLPVGTIFSDSGDFYIKINQDEILNDLAPADDCNFGIKIDKNTVPNAVRLSDGSAAYFGERCEIYMIYRNATLSIS